MKRIVIILLLLLSIVGITLLLKSKISWNSPEENLINRYAHLGPVLTDKSIDSILGSFKTVSYKKLPEDYCSFSESDQAPYSTMLKNKVFYKLNRGDLFKPIVRNFQVREFVTKDDYYERCITDSTPYYWLVDPLLLKKLLELQQSLDDLGHDPEGFHLRFGHRHPKENQAVGGAPKSRHLTGQAIDLGIDDINFDGIRDGSDKKIVLDLLENKIIGNGGGIGRYPKTMVVHFDVRGHRARWDYQKKRTGG